MRITIGCFALLATCAPVASAQQPAPRNQCSVDSTNSEPIRLYLSPIRIDSGYRLTPNGYSGATHVGQTVDFTEHADSVRVVSILGVPTRRIDTWNAVQFVSPPLAGPFDLSGFFSGQLEFITNKQDFDFQISLYELTPNGDYVLSSIYSTQTIPPRARAVREPIQQKIRQYRDYASACFPKRLIQNGSRLVVLLTITKPHDDASSVARRDVSDSTLGDPNEPLKISWYGDSYIQLRVHHH